MIAAAIATIASAPFVVLTAEIIAGLWPVADLPAGDGPAPATTILVPAHNEATGIAATIAAIRATMPPGTRILVVADNCTDATADVARRNGADVIERQDPAHRGKGFALAFGRDAMAGQPPDVVIILDADCTPHGDTVARISRTAAHLQRPVQAINLVDPPASTDSMGRVSTFAFRVKNLVRQRGLQRLTGTCVLTGTGMALPWALFALAPLATADSVEDLALGLSFVVNGTPPALCEGTLVTSPSPSADAAVAQRTRWEHGFMATALRVAPQMWSVGLRKRRWAPFWLGLHLTVPPLALLILIGLATLGGLMLLSVNAAAGFALVFSIAMATVFAAWLTTGREILPAALLWKLPGYILWKLPIYLRLARGADRRWTRTERD